MNSEIIIAGAGISGCAAAATLLARKSSCQLIEMNTEAGGLTRSIALSNGLYDYTGHFLHLANWPSPEDIPYANLHNHEWQKITKKAGIFLKGHIIPAPFQYNLAALPPSDRHACIKSYLDRPLLAPNNFKDYLLTHFGQKISSLFLIPYNMKSQSINLDKLSVAAVKRFFPPPNEKKIVAGFDHIEKTPSGYNSHFWYPRHNGIGLLANGLLHSAAQVMQTSTQIFQIDLPAHRITTNRGKFRYDCLLSSLPLKQLCQMTRDPELIQLSLGLSHNRVLCCNLLLKKTLSLNGMHWLYFPEKQYTFYRLGIYSNIPHHPTPPGAASIYIETAANTSQRKSTYRLLKKIIKELELLGIAKSHDIDSLTANWIECAYVHFTAHHAHLVETIKQKLKSHHIHLIGRYGLWDYISMEDSIQSGFQAAAAIL